MQTEREKQTGSIDILAIAAHRDDVEQTCGGTLLKMAEHGHRTGILDLTRGEMGTRGTAGDRGREAEAAARILKVSWRRALDIPDGRVENTWENRVKVARVLRDLRPRVVILPYWQGRHPDHYTTSTLGYEACFLAGLSKLELPDISESLEPAVGRIDPTHPSAQNQGVIKGHPADNFEPADNPDSITRSPAHPLTSLPHRPFKIVYATLYYDVRPTFVVDITDQFEARLESLLAYESQYQDQTPGQDLFPARAEVRTRIEAMARFYGLLAGVAYAEPFLQKEVGLVEDLTTIPVKSI